MENSKYNNNRNLYKDKLTEINKIKQKIFKTLIFNELKIIINENSHIDVKNLLIALKKKLSSKIINC